MPKHTSQWVKLQAVSKYYKVLPHLGKKLAIEAASAQADVTRSTIYRWLARERHEAPSYENELDPVLREELSHRKFSVPCYITL